MDRALFTTRIANSLQEGYCELFVGSGLSCNAGLPNWKDLLRPIAKAYKYDVDRSSDLPAIAQYIINANCGNRNILTSLISDSFGCHCEPSSVHSVISDMSFKRIWTTNYDSLLEDSFRVHHNVLVVKKDDDLKQVPHKNDITIIKMHGSYDELDSVVLTSSDYDKYFATHPLISEQFSASLVNRSFLFIGYSYNDPDIRSIMTEAQVKLHGTQNHYLITRAPQRDCPDESNKDFEYRQLMFNSWKTELNRLGIHVLEIERYNQLEEVLLEILIKARGNNVFVTGSHNNNTTIAHQDAIVSSLLKNNAVFVYGQSSGIGLSYLNAFCEKAAQEKIDIGNRIRFFSNPYSINSSFSNDKSLIPELKRLRYDLFKNTRLMIFYPGGMGTLAELELALEHHCLVLPIVSKDESYNNEVVKAFFEAPNALKQLDKVSPQYAEALSKREIPSVDILGHTISQCLEV